MQSFTIKNVRYVHTNEKPFSRTISHKKIKIYWTTGINKKLNLYFATYLSKSQKCYLIWNLDIGNKEISHWRSWRGYIFSLTFRCLLTTCTQLNLWSLLYLEQNIIKNIKSNICVVFIGLISHIFDNLFFSLEARNSLIIFLFLNKSKTLLMCKC